MKVSAFTFIKNGVILGYPFIESIKSILPIVDEFIVAVGKSEDNTLEEIKTIDSKKIKIIETNWNEKMKDRGYVYGQQKMISQFNCSGDWAFYLEGDEVVHENDLDKIYNCMKKYKDDNEVEAIVFNYFHFYGNANSYLNSPGWYRQAPRIIKNSIRSYAPDGLFWLVLEKNKIGRYPKAVNSMAYIYHYGWVRSDQQMNLKSKKVQKYWNKPYKKIDYREIDQEIIQPFRGEHPKIVQNWLPKDAGLFQANPHHKLSKKEKKHRILSKLEKLFNLELSKKHFKIVK